MRYEGTARASRAFDDGSGTRVVVSTLGPGSLGGDALRIDGCVRTGAHLIVESQSATKIYGPGISRYQAHWTVAEGGTLELRNEPLLLFGDAAYTSSTEVLLARGSRLCIRECAARAEEASATAEITTIVRIDQRLALRDSMQLDDETLGARAIGTLVGFGGIFRETMTGTGVRIGIGSTLLGGTFLRISGDRAWDVKAALESVYAIP